MAYIETEGVGEAAVILLGWRAEKTTFGALSKQTKEKTIGRGKKLSLIGHQRNRKDRQAERKKGKNPKRPCSGPKKIPVLTTRGIVTEKSYRCHRRKKRRRGPDCITGSAKGLDIDEIRDE